MNLPDVWNKVLQGRGIRRDTWKPQEAAWLVMDTKYREGEGWQADLRFLKRTYTKINTCEIKEWVPKKEDLTATDWRTITC